MQADPRSRLSLPQVTICAATSINVSATLHALEHSLAQIDFAACKLFTDADVTQFDEKIEIIQIDRLETGEDYSKFILKHLADHIETSHCLIVQWDGYVIDASKWQSAFLNFDYIGARWPQFQDGFDVGNGGFSLRSLRLMKACQSLEFQFSHPEDLAIGRVNRHWLEQHGMRFASGAIADNFSIERKGFARESFGYHGVWHMPLVVGNDAFWKIYLSLDDRKTLRVDLFYLAALIIQSPGGLWRAARLFFDQVCDTILQGWKYSA